MNVQQFMEDLGRYTNLNTLTLRNVDFFESFTIPDELKKLNTIVVESKKVKFPIIIDCNHGNHDVLVEIDAEVNIEDLFKMYLKNVTATFKLWKLAYTR